MLLPQSSTRKVGIVNSKRPEIPSSKLIESRSTSKQLAKSTISKAARRNLPTVSDVTIEKQRCKEVEKKRKQFEILKEKNTRKSIIYGS